MGASLISGVVMTAFMYLAAPVFGARLGDFAPLVAMRLGLAATSAPALAVGLLTLMGAALIWGLIYAPVRAAVPGPDWAVGLGYGLAIWAVGRWAVLPLLGISATLGSPSLTLGAHLVFGLLLAWTSRGNRLRR